MSVPNGKQLKKWREDQGYSQEQMGKHLGVHRGTVSKYETDALDVPADVLKKYKTLSNGKKSSLKKTTVKKVNIKPKPKSTKQIKMTAEYLVNWRQERNFTQKQLGDILQLKRSSISDYENEASSIPDYISDALIAYENGTDFKKPIVVSQGKIEVIQRYEDIVKKENRRPLYNDFTGPEIDKIKYHYRTMRNFHEEMKEQLDLSDHLFEMIDILSPEKINALEEAIQGYDRYIITTAVSSKKVFEPFLNSIKSYCEKTNTALIVLVSMDAASRKKETDFTIDPLLDSPDVHVIHEEVKINQNLFISDIKVSAKQINPLTGFSRICQRQQSSAILASPKQYLEYVAVTADHYRQPYAFMTTGAITVPDYESDLFMSQRTSYIAEKDHTLGAVVVERVNKKKFHFRHIQSDSDGSIVDLGIKYSASGKTEEVSTVLVMGDYHSGVTDPKVKKATEQMCSDHNIVDIVLHDFFDGFSISHHDRAYIGKMARKAELSLHILEDEIKCGSKELGYLQSLVPGKLIMVKSNHDEFLDRYLDAGAFVKDHVNYKISLDLHHHMLISDNREDVLSYAYKKYGIPNSYDPDRIVWLARDEPYALGPIELSAHGDLGPNGARASLQNLEKAHGPCVVGHSHTAAIFRSVFRVGTSSLLSLDYNRGPSSWTHTHCFVYENGSRQLINIIDGDWKLG